MELYTMDAIEGRIADSLSAGHPSSGGEKTEVVTLLPVDYPAESQAPGTRLALKDILKD
jgi:hypothetical protein